MKTHAFESYREKYENDLTDPGTFFTDIAEAAVGGPEKSVPPARVRERFRVRGFVRGVQGAFGAYGLFVRSMP